jgi:hypothetical protein
MLLSDSPGVKTTSAVVSPVRSAESIVTVGGNRPEVARRRAGRVLRVERPDDEGVVALVHLQHDAGRAALQQRVVQVALEADRARCLYRELGDRIVRQRVRSFDGRRLRAFTAYDLPNVLGGLPGARSRSASIRTTLRVRRRSRSRARRTCARRTRARGRERAARGWRPPPPVRRRRGFLPDGRSQTRSARPGYAL